MDTNFNNLRKEAYNFWGINSQDNIIYNFPKSFKKNNFKFKLDFSDRAGGWPRVYTLAVDNEQNIKRAIFPILLIRNYFGKTIKEFFWYDTAHPIYEAMLSLAEENKELKRNLSYWKKVWNKHMFEKYKFKEVDTIEDYIFNVFVLNEEVIVELQQEN